MVKMASGSVSSHLFSHSTRPVLWLCLLLFIGLGWGPETQARGLPDFTKLVEENEAAVVNISTVGEKPDPRQRQGQPRDDQLEEFFRFFGPPNGRSAPRQRRSLGSGFIVDETGYVITNNHVVEGAAELVVRLRDRSEYIAELIGTDPRSDLALLKVAAEDDLPYLKIGDSEDLKVGEWVLAIGSPFGFDYSVTAGIVSAKGRSLANPQLGNYVPFIQTDVAINPGNSGGPLFNLKGEVVGINSQIYSNSGGFMGVSFAIPIDMVMEVVAQLKDNGRVLRGWLGVEIMELTRDLALGFGLDRPRGALVSRVMPDSPAAKGGIKEEDIIVEFNGKPIDRSGELPQYVGRARVGEDSELTVIREGREQTLSINIGELPGSLTARTQVEQPGSEKNRLGILARNLSAELQERLSLSSGVEVTEVDGIAAQAGLRPGDVILRMRNRAVANTDTLAAIVAEVNAGDIIPVLVLRQDRRIFLPLKVPAEE